MKGRVIGIQWGSIAPNNGTDTYSTTVVAVVTDEYTISVFTADGGKLLWQAEIAPEDHQAMEVNQASIAITSQRLYKTDEGMIVVAMPAVNSQKVPLTVYAAFNGKDGARHWRYLSDGGGLLDDLVAEAELLANPDTAIGGRDADLPKVRKIAPEKPAAKGETIEKEVEEDNDNEEEEEENEKEEVVVEGEKNEEEEPEENEEGPRQGEKLENTKDRNNVAAEAISAIEKKGSIAYISRKYEQSWSTYRQGVLSALPHHYDHPWDTSLDKHVFFRMKGRDSQTSPSTPYHAKAGGNLAFFYHNYTDGRSVVLRKNDEDYDVLGKQLTSWQQSLRGQQQEQQGATTQEGSGPNTLVFHNKDGMEVIHLFTGDAMTRLLPLRSEGVFYDDVNDDDYIESIETMIGARLGKGTDEVVQSHEDCHGLIHTGVPLGSDELMRVTICDSVGYFGSFDILRYFFGGRDGKR
ncbi:hypothetical protein AGDE_15349 [Angomonas deanei]|uniref:Uncharacterized protein n=1 Tax=Angomonas deanei TaxID=59799 RepID=A0A7G2C897_9TRYP|nr:hypothetical protein AGDE_15349 [Angomonas deanei]CAD2216080.1 hypothetical protein, conserved [Angomonas deanei]|eukprot:EPY19236.1 hypothetical protein AGDE_15349 [Angomonas deanei]